MTGAGPKVCAVFAVSASSEEYLERGARVAVSSLRRASPWLPIVVLHSDDLSAAQRRLFDGCDLRRADVQKYQRSARALMERPDLDTSVFLRFTVGSLTDYDVALYLDCDVVVLDCIASMAHMPGALVCRQMPSHPLAEQFVDGRRVLEAEGLGPDLSAVNAGVMKIDLNAWRDDRMEHDVFACIERYGWDEFAYCDQSLINLVGYTTGRLEFLPKPYNFMLWPDMREVKSRFVTNRHGLIAPETGEGAARIVHWTGPLKPWHEAFSALALEEQEQYCGPCYRQFVDESSG